MRERSKGAALATGMACCLALSPLCGAQETGERESPWLLTPTASSDPKLGTRIGFFAGYIPRLDPGSTQSMIAAFGNYSDTDSYTFGLFGDLYFKADQHKVMFGAFGGKIRNEYDDFLGTGLTAKTEDDMEGLFGRYSYRVADNWYLGAQAVSTNYVIGADGTWEPILGLIGLTGFDSNALGLVAEFDSRDNVRNATRGRHFITHNFAYRESLGGDESFDTLQAEFVQMIPFGEQHVLAVQARGRWTHDAPLAGYSSLTLRGYTRGNYLAEHYSHIDVDARFHLRGRWGLTAFAGIGCLYSKVSDCGNSEDLYASAGGGISYLLKPDAGIVLRAEYAVGEQDNSAFLFSVGQPF